METLLETLEEINDQNAFIRMGYVDMQGMGYIVDISGKQYVGVDLHDRPYIQKALAGEAYAVSYTHLDVYKRQHYNRLLSGCQFRFLFFFAPFIKRPRSAPGDFDADRKQNPDYLYIV